MSQSFSVKPTSEILFKKINTTLEEYKFNYTTEKKHWSAKFYKYWKVGESGAKKNFDKFLNNGAKNYSVGRNFPSTENVSKLSPYIHWGEISPFEVWHGAKNKMSGENKKVFLSEIGRREFAYHLLYNFPNLQEKNLKNNFDSFPWQENENFLKKWEKGMTGFPIVDAGMRELWETGYMHNRLRMVTASFLTKDLGINWQEGERYFANKLLDFDLSANNGGWQWAASTGCDAQPYFRIFNPTSQAKKFDPDGEFIKKYVGELRELPRKLIFEPWKITTLVEGEREINYTKRIIDHDEARKKTLKRFLAISENNQ